LATFQLLSDYQLWRLWRLWQLWQLSRSVEQKKRQFFGIFSRIFVAFCRFFLSSGKNILFSAWLYRYPLQHLRKYRLFAFILPLKPFLMVYAYSFIPKKQTALKHPLKRFKMTI
jgi:hypothetical protein